MRKYQNIISKGLAIVGLVSLLGCNRPNKTVLEDALKPIDIYNPYNDGAHTTEESGISVALGDIDGDGKLDLIVANPSHVRAYLNKDGKFVPQLK